jgi:4-amino-4-deoxy-L-arabinose transferase-like glycosyltransferase
MTARRLIPRIDTLLVGFLTLFALALRLLDLGARALLPDESSSFYFSQLPLATLLWSLCDPHPPGYYLLLRGVAVLGEGEMWLRLPSALAGALAVPLTWAVARAALRPTAQPGQRWPDQAALLAAALLAVAPMAVWYSQEARPYALLSLSTLAMVWTGLRWRLRPTRTAAEVFLLLGWLALWVEYGALVILLGLNLFLLSGWPWQPANGKSAGSDRRWLALHMALLAPFGLWWLISAQPAALARMSYQAIFLAVQAQGLGIDWTPEVARRVIVAVALAGAGLGLGLALAVRRSSRVRRWLGSPWLAAALLGLVLALGLLGALPRLYTVKRHLNALLPFISIAAAWALLHTGIAPGLARRAAAGGAVGLLLALSLAMLLTAPQPAWPQLVETLAGQLQDGDAIWVDELDAPVFAYYWQERSPWQPLRVRDLDALNRTPGEQRVWLVGSVTAYRDLRQTLPQAFAAKRVVGDAVVWRDAALTAYDGSVQPQPVAAPPLAMVWGLAFQSPLEVDCRP